MNLIDSALKSVIESNFDDLFDTFARSYTFTAFKAPEQTVVAINSDYNGDWDRPQNTNGSTFVEVSQAFPARLWYLNAEQQYKMFFLEGKQFENAKIIREAEKVKLQVRLDAWDFIKDSTRIIIDGASFEPISAPQKVGMFDFKYVALLLQRNK